MKRSPMTRKTPMRRTAMKRAAADHRYTSGLVEAIMAQNRPAKRSGLKRSSSLRAQQRRQYNRLKPGYLEAHPYCQITIAFLGLNEAEVIHFNGSYWIHRDPASKSRWGVVPRANQLHHRNKANGIRLIDFNYIMSACDAAHDWTEKKKDQARAIGVLCPINCRPDGTMPDGTKQPTTTELLTQRHTEKTK